jgi:hypothetical protein
MVFQPGVQGPGRGGVRKKPALMLPPLPPMPADEESMETWAVPVREAGQLIGVSWQTLHQAIERGTLPAYRWRGHKYVLIADLTDSAYAKSSRTIRAATDEVHQLEWRRTSHRINVDALRTLAAIGASSVIPVEDRCTGEWETCEVCGPVTDQYEQEGNEPAPVPTKRPVSAAKLAAIAKARAVLAVKRAGG